MLRRAVRCWNSRSGQAHGSVPATLGESATRDAGGVPGQQAGKAAPVMNEGAGVAWQESGFRLRESCRSAESRRCLAECQSLNPISGIQIDDKKVALLSNRIRRRVVAGKFGDFDAYYLGFEWYI